MPFASLQRSLRPLPHFSRRHLQVRQLLPAILVLLLVATTGYLFLGEGYISYRRPIPPFPLNVQLGLAKFKVLQAQYTNRLHWWPGCMRGEPDFLLIETSATRFEELITYSHRLISPNDNELAVLFVTSFLPEQPWREFAQGHFPSFHHQLNIPPNCLGKMYIRQGNYVGMGEPVNRARLIDLNAWRNQQTFRYFESATNYFTDSLSERQVDEHPSRPNQEPRITSSCARRISPHDAAYYSPLRTRIRQWSRNW